MEDAADVLDTIDFGRVEDMLQQEVANLRPLNIVSVPGDYHEMFEVSLLRDLQHLVERDPSDFARKHGKTKDSVESLQRDITALLTLVQNGDTDATMPVSYHHIFDNLGRGYAPAPAFQTLDGGLRKLIGAPHYWDLDMANCYPVLLMNICQTLRKPGGTPMLAMYVNQRDM